MKKFNVGDRVGCVYGQKQEKVVYGEKPRYGSVISEPFIAPNYYGTGADNRVMVMFDGGKTAVSRGQSELYPEHELKEKFVGLEEMFNRLSKEVGEKINEASDAIDAAQQIAKKFGYDVSEISDAIKPLENAMDNAGWRTSSWNC